MSNLYNLFTNIRTGYSNVLSLFCAVLISGLFCAQNLMGQTTIYSTNFGAANVTTSPLQTGWTTSGTAADAQLSTASVSGTYTTPITASGGANLADLGTTVSTAQVDIAGVINTTGYNSIDVIWGARASSATYTGTWTFSWSSDGTTYNTITYTDITRSSATWQLVNAGVPITLPAGAANQANLRFRIAINRTSTGGNYRIDDFTVRGVLPTPTINTSLSTVGGMNYFFGAGPSNEKSFTVSGTNLTTNLVVTPPTNYEISTGTGGSFVSTSPISLTPTSGSVSSTTIYIRLKSGLSTGSYNSQNISCTSTSATTKNVACNGGVYSGQFTTGNIAVEVVGDGTSALSSAAAQVNVWEFNPTTGVLTNPFTLPRAASTPSSSPFNVTESGSATTGGQMIRASNGAFLSVAGYNATIGTLTINTSASATNKRVIAKVSKDGSVSTSAYDFFSGAAYRSIASNGYSFWTAGTVGGGVGLYYLKDAASTPVSMGSINTRVVQVYNNNLYFSTASTGSVGIYQLGQNGLPVKASDAVSSRLTDATYAAQAGASPYSFTINPSGNILYIADDATFSSTSTQIGGVIKYTKSGSTWSYQYTLRVNSTITNGARGLEVDWSGANPVLYITSGNSSEIYKLTDNGVAASGTGTVLTSLTTLGVTNYAFRGLQFAPVSQPTELTCTASQLDFGAQPPAGVSSEKVFNVAGTGFTGNITVSAPSAQYGISLTPGGPYTTSVTITASGTPNSGNSTVYMVLSPSVVGTYNGNLTISASGATTVTVPVTGSCIQPVNYYNVSGADMTIPSNWGTNTNGTGTNPVNFTDNGQYFNIVNNPGLLTTMQTTANLSPSAATTNTQNTLTFANPPTCPNSPSSFVVGATITGTGIPVGTTITSIVGNVVYMSASATATSASITVSVPVAPTWTISGTLSKIIVGDGSVARSFSIPTTQTVTSTIDVKNLGTLVLQNSTLPTLGQLEINSTVNYNQTGSVAVVIPSGGSYGNLLLQGSTPSSDIRTLPVSSPLTLPFQVLGNFTVDAVTVLGASTTPFTYMGLQGNLTGTNGAIFGGNPVLTTTQVPSIITIGDNNQTISYTGGVVKLYTFTSQKTAGTLTLGGSTQFLTFGQSGTYTGTQLNYSGTASFVSQAGSVLTTTGNANIDVTFTGTGQFTLGGNIDATNTSSSLLTVPTSNTSQVYFNMGAGTTMNDGGNTITCGSHFGTKGSKSAYNLTGTVVMTPSLGITRIQNDNTSQGLFVADLNNLTFNPTGSATNLSIQPTTGNNTLTIKGNVTIGGTATTSKIQPNANTIQVGGNWTNSRIIDMVSAGTSTFEFNGTSAQTFTTGYPSGESFYNVKLNNTSGLTLSSGSIRISNLATLTCLDGELTTGSNKVILNATANISETTTSFVTGNVESTRSLTNSLEAFGGMGVEVTALGTAPGATTVTRVTGTSQSIGCESKSNKRQFNFTSVTNNTGLNATIKYKWLGSTSELNGLDFNFFNLFTGGGPWTLINPNATVNVASKFISVTGQSSLGSYVASIPNPTLGTLSQSTICASNGASIDVIGLLPNATYTVGYTIGGVSQTPITGVTSDVSGNATFVTPTLSVSNDGQSLAIVSLNRTDMTSACSQSFSTGNSVVLDVNPIPTISTVTQTGTSCENSNATISLTGLVPSTTSTFTYTIDGGSPQTLTGVTSNGSGNATLSVPVVLVNDGQTFEITSIQITSNSPTCSLPLSSGNSVVLYVNPRPTGTFSANDFVCQGQTAPIDVYFTGTQPWNLQYSINGTPQVAINTSSSPYSMPYTNATVARTYAVTALTDSKGCSATILDNFTIDVPVPCSITWNGSVSSDWNNKDNWTPNNSAPSNKTSVVIPSQGVTNQPNITATGPVCASITLQGNAQPQISSGFTLNVRGDLNGGSSPFFIGDGKVIINGTGTQTVNGTVRLKNVDITNTSPGGIVIPSGSKLQIEPNGVVTFSANTKLTNNGQFVLASDASGVGKIGPIPTTVTITGELTQEQYLPQTSGVGSWYFIGTPFSGKTFTDYTDDFRVMGLPTGVGAQTGVYPSVEPERSTVFKYVEAQHNVKTDTVQKQGWRIPGNENLTVGMGYRMWVKYYENPSHRVDNVGQLTRNDFTFPQLTRNEYTPCYPTTPMSPLYCDESLRGWNLLSNPYPCDINWDAVGGWTKPTQMSNAFYRWNSTGGGYGVYAGGIYAGTTPIPSNPNLIPQSQAFFVRLATAGTYTSNLVVKESAKSASTGQFLRTSVNPDIIRVSLNHSSSVNGSDAVIRFMTEATDGFDQDYDFYALSGVNFTLTIPVNNESMSIASYSPVTDSKVIPLDIRTNGVNGNYSMKFTGLQSVLGTTNVYLRDNYTGIIKELSDNEEYSFDLDAQTNVSNRFELVFSNQVMNVKGSILDYNTKVCPNPVTKDKFTVEVNGTDGQVMVELVDILGRKLATKTTNSQNSKSVVEIQKPSTSGQYRVVIHTKNGVITKTLIVQ